jgi:hypothetical protein
MHTKPPASIKWILEDMQPFYHQSKPPGSTGAAGREDLVIHCKRSPAKWLNNHGFLMRPEENCHTIALPLLDPIEAKINEIEAKLSIFTFLGSNVFCTQSTLN